MKIYLDNCCLNRPYDDLSDDIVRMESEAILAIIDRCENNDWNFFKSDVLFEEISRSTNIIKKQKVLLLYESAKLQAELTNAIVLHAKKIEQFGIKSFDALHLASAIIFNADVFLTTDRKLINTCKRIDIKIKVMNPLIWLTEVLYEQ